MKSARHFASLVSNDWKFARRIFPIIGTLLLAAGAAAADKPNDDPQSRIAKAEAGPATIDVSSYPAPMQAIVFTVIPLASIIKTFYKTLLNFILRCRIASVLNKPGRPAVILLHRVMRPGLGGVRNQRRHVMTKGHIFWHDK